MNKKIIETIDFLIESNVVPNSGLFDISEEMLDKYVSYYSSFSIGNNKHKKTYARKLAGLNLLNFKIANREGNYKNCKEGFVYAISNPAWPDHLKVGMSIDINKRLSSFQTYSPYRDYSIKTYEFCLNRHLAEKEIQKRFSFLLEESGEWIKTSKYEEVVRFIRDDIHGRIF